MVMPKNEFWHHNNDLKKNLFLTHSAEKKE